MDIKLTKDGSRASALEYNAIGGILDFYFFAGSDTDPTEVVCRSCRLKFRISRLGSASADLDTRVRSTLLSRFRI